MSAVWPLMQSCVVSPYIHGSDVPSWFKEATSLKNSEKGDNISLSWQSLRIGVGHAVVGMFPGNNDSSVKVWVSSFSVARGYSKDKAFQNGMFEISNVVSGTVFDSMIGRMVVSPLANGAYNVVSFVADRHAEQGYRLKHRRNLPYELGFDLYLA